VQFKGNIIINQPVFLTMTKVKFHYIKDDSYTPRYSNGAIGGITSKGEIVINFFTELPPIPVSQTQGIEGAILTKEVTTEMSPKESPSELNANRIINTGVILNEATAIDIYNWLGVQLETLKSLKNADSK
jgi:hypothetical protein